MLDDGDPRAVAWQGGAVDGALVLLDQRLLPGREVRLSYSRVEDVACAIREMVVRGAPAIGVTAAYGMVLAARPGSGVELARASALLSATRPTAVNLFWALERAMAQATVDASPEAMLRWALALHEEDIAGNGRMAELGAARLEAGMGVLTHCNAGALATGGVGTAVGVILRAHRNGKRLHVYVDETRPRLQGARLTAWELARAGVPHTLICDNMAASLMARGKIQLCVTGADRIAANGDAANKIGTYSVAVNAHHHRLPFHVAAPASTFDLGIASGADIVIEERGGEEIWQWGDERTCPAQTPVYNPSFDVTPASLITSLFTDRGEVAPVTGAEVRRVLGGA